MTKKQVLILVALGLFVLLGILTGIFARGKKTNNPESGGNSLGSNTKDSPSFEEFYNPETPKGATLTVPKNEAPASNNESLGSKARFFDIKASSDGFLPSSITVNRGDTVYFDLTAVDGDYDLDIPYLGTHFNKVESGETKRLPFDANTSGSFVFQCRDYCPRSGVIKGSLIILE